MVFYQLSLINVKLLRFNFLGAIIILTIICYMFNDFNIINKQVGKLEVPPFPNNPGIKKIDVGRGEDFWILTDYNEVMKILSYKIMKNMKLTYILIALSLEYDQERTF